mgnify:CR=1 FL=1
MMEQPQYNMFHRTRMEQEYYPLFQQPYNIGTTIWSPLASGLLTNKYADGIPEDARANQKGYEFIKGILEKWRSLGNIDKIKKLDEYTKEMFGSEFSVAQLALAWCIKNPNVTTVLLGATKVRQIEENLKALELVPKITEEHMKKLDSMLESKPENYEGWGATTGRRKFNTI